VPLPSGTVERWFSRGWFAAIQPPVTAASNLTSVAWLDLIILATAGALVLWLGLGLPRLLRRGRLRAIGTAVMTTATIVASVYVLFLALWGLNYRRAPVTAGLDFDTGRVTAAGVSAAALRAVESVNRLYEPPTSDERSGEARMLAELEPAFRRAQQALGGLPGTRPGRPKRTLLAPFFRWASVDGMMNPLALEVLVNSDLLPAERPFVVAHEWAHLAGYAQESEASFVGWVTCLQGSRPAQYSGWLAMYIHLVRALSPEDRKDIVSRLGDGPREDLRAITARLSTSRPAVRTASWRAYDRFLKANKVESGVRSYDEVVRLVVGTRLPEPLTPNP
jgi:Protein of unknown function (DUF3810)